MKQTNNGEIEQHFNISDLVGICLNGEEVHLVGGIPTPLKIGKSVGIMTFPTEWKNTCSKLPTSQTMQRMEGQQQKMTESVDKNRVEYHIGIEPKKGNTPWYQQLQIET